MSIKTIFKSAVLVMALMCLTFLTTWAQTKETLTATWIMDGTSGTLQNNDTELFTENGNKTLWYSTTNSEAKIKKNPNSKKVNFGGHLINDNAEIIFPDLDGTVTKVEFNSCMFKQSGMQMYVGLDKTNTSKLLHLKDSEDDYDYPSIDQTSYFSVTFVGSVIATKDNPLKIMFSGNNESVANFTSKGSIVITYEGAAAVDPQHTFTFSASGNTLTATCVNNAANHECGLTNRISTLTLTASNASFNMRKHGASLNQSEFVAQTGLSVSCSLKYINKSTNAGSIDAPSEPGDYTASATVTINGNAYTLTKDFSIVDDRIIHSITNNSTGIGISTGTAYGGDEITIWVKDYEIELTALNVTGETANLTLNNGIGYSEYTDTYHFAMPDEDVTISATFEAPITINCKNGGSVSATVGENTNATRAQSGETVTLSATPDEGYTVTKVHVYNGNNTYNVIDNGDGTFSFTMPASAVTVEVEFSKTIGALTISYFGDRTTATIDGSSNYSLSIADDIDVDEVTYTRSFVNDGGAYTIMLPFGFNASSVKGTFHTLGDITPVTETVWKAEPSSAITEIEANTPYIFFPSEDFNEMTFENVTLKTTTSEPLTNVCGNTNWKLHGVYDRKVWTDEDVNLYGFAAAPQGEIAAGEFVHFVTGASLKPTRCYLEYSKDGFSKSAIELPEKIIVLFPDETASIVEPGDPDDNGEITTPTAEITPNSGIKVWSADGLVIIEAQPDMDYTIVDLSGRTLKNGVTHSTRETVTLSRRAAGIVIVKIGNQTFKISY